MKFFIIGNITLVINMNDAFNTNKTFEFQLDLIDLVKDWIIPHLEPAQIIGKLMENLKHEVLINLLK